MTKHTLSVLVENRPAVLARVAGLFARRGFNIHSLAVGPTEHAELSRMTVVVDVADLPLEQVTKQLNKLINVIKVVELDETACISREMVLVKVKATPANRTQVLEIIQMFRAKVIDVAPDSVIVEATGTQDKVDALMRMLEPHGIKELVQSGVIALARGPKAMNERSSRNH
ncbi:MAG: acetolactate synthase small subunit [Micrococcales bacterium]|nr:MAG: acetolactate synthase small subunit [Micrococcales bacterium]PIE27540.1 MAG: acetolactate synthase small subunit [Micrococcales bacterium]